MGQDIDIEQFLNQAGFISADAVSAARRALIAADLTREGKKRMSVAKIDRARALLDDRLILSCAAAACLAEAGRTGRSIVPASKRPDCAICEGSDNQRAVDLMIEEATRAGVRRIVVVGGSPGTREDLRALVKERVELRLVDGTAKASERDARADLRWADVVAIWGSTELAHKVSRLYTSGATAARRITVQRRGIGALASEVVRTLRAGRGG